MFLVIERWVTRSVLAIVVVGILALAYWWGNTGPAVTPPSAPPYQSVSSPTVEPSPTSPSDTTLTSPAPLSAATTNGGPAAVHSDPGGGPQRATNEANDAVVALGQSDFFARYRMDRERARGQQQELYEKMAGDPQLNTTNRQEAQRALLALATSRQQETDIENLLRAKGFQDALVILDNRGATVVIPDQEMTPAKAAQIGELVHRLAGTPLDEIAILPVGV